MALITGRVVFSAGSIIYAADHNTNDGTIWNDYNGNITNANISGSAAIAYSKLNLTGSVLNADLAGSIADSKLSQITTASKVSGAALTSLSSIPAGAGVIPIANLASGTANGSKFIRDDGSLQIPSSLSNVIFNWTGLVDTSATTGIVNNSATNSISADNKYVYIMIGQSITSSSTVLRSKWIKIAGISTVIAYANIWKKSGATDMKCQVDIGSSSGASGSVSATSPGTWANWTIDVSGLSNGTAYDLTIGLFNPTASGGDGSYAYLGAIILFGS